MTDELTSDNFTLFLILAVWLAVTVPILAMCIFRPDKLDYFKKPEKEEEHEDLFI